MSADLDEEALSGPATGPPDLDAATLAKLDAELTVPERCIPFCSRAPQHPWFDRADVLWLGFGTNPEYAWHSMFEFQWIRVLSPYGPKWERRRKTVIKPLTARMATHPGGQVERAIAILTTWRVLTTHQFAAFAGMSRKKVSPLLKSMLEAGLLERGVMKARFEIGRAIPYLWRLRRGEELSAWMKALSPQRAWGITLGGDMGAGGHDRHDILAAEIALRAAEVIPGLQGILGERAAGAKELFTDHPDTRIRGDVVIVREDGLRIVLEITTQPKIREVSKKMARWARMLGERGGPNATGVVVVFVAANHERTAGTLQSLKNNHDLALVAHAMGAAGPAPPEHVRMARAGVFLAHWQDWFPAQSFISEDFADLLVSYASAAGKWSQVRLAQSGPGGVPFVPPDDGRDWKVLLRARESFHAVPRWIDGPIRSEITPAVGPQ